METVLVFLIFFTLTFPAVIFSTILSLIVLAVLLLKRRKRGKVRSLTENLCSVAIEETSTAENSVRELSALTEVTTLERQDTVSEMEGEEQPLAIVPEWSETTCKTLFQEFVIARLKALSFEIRSKHTGDEVLNFEQEGVENSQAISIAIVGVWKPAFIKGRIEWARSFQMISYRNYEKAENRPIFVLIGIGGSPDVPESVYIVPLKQIRSNVLSEIQLRSCLLPSEEGVVFESVI